MGPLSYKIVFLGVLTVAQLARAADTQPPSVTITQPTNGSTLGGVVGIAASATDNVAVASVSLQLDGAAVVSPLTSPPFKLLLNTARLANGGHSLLAVATDTAGNSSRSSLVQITVTNPARYTLGPGPFTMEDFGSPMSGCSIDREAFFQLSNNTHFICDYIGNYSVSPIQILDVNLTQGTVRLTNSSVGRSGNWCFVLYTNGLIYEATMAPGVLFSYNPATGATRQIAQTTGGSPQYSDIGDDGWIYLGEYPCAYVDRYNPNTDTFQRLGNMETDTNGNFGSYAYYVGADSRYVYITDGESPWYLVVYDTLTTNLTQYWKTSGDSIETLRHGTNGYWYYLRENSTNGLIPTWYIFTNGAPVPVSTASVPPAMLRGMWWMELTALQSVII